MYLVSALYVFSQTKFQSYKICFFLQNESAFLIVFLLLILDLTIIYLEK